MAITGVVAAEAREAVIPLTVLGANGARVDLQAAVDTGFTGHVRRITQ